MSDADRRERNRQNARRSTGPRTAEGKRRVATNALRHGLAIPVAAVAEMAPIVEKLTALLAGEGASPERLELARRVAEAEADLMRIGYARRNVLTEVLTHPTPKNYVKNMLRLCGKVLDSHGHLSQLYWGPLMIAYRDLPGSLRKLNEIEHFEAVLTERSKELQSLNRYERRARSRMISAVRDFDSLSPRT